MIQPISEMYRNWLVKIFICATDGCMKTAILVDSICRHDVYALKNTSVLDHFDPQWQVKQFLTVETLMCVNTGL